MGSINVIGWRAFLPMVLLGVFFAYSFSEFANTDYAIAFSFVFFKANKMNIKYLFIMTMVIIITLKYNIAFCGDTDVNPLGNIQETATQIVFDQMTDRERDEFLRNVGYRPINGWEAVDHYHQYGSNTNSFNYQGLLLWLAGTSVLFIFARWGDIIRDFFFSLPLRTVNVVDLAPDFYTGLSVIMRDLGREATFRQEITAFIQNPENTIAVTRAIEAYLRSRGMAA
jgi:hypothetical protein